jgi:hypothetical protein
MVWWINGCCCAACCVRSKGNHPGRRYSRVLREKMEDLHWRNNAAASRNGNASRRQNVYRCPVGFDVSRRRSTDACTPNVCIKVVRSNYPAVSSSRFHQWEAWLKEKRLLRDAYISTVLSSSDSGVGSAFFRADGAGLVSLFSLSLPMLSRSGGKSSLGLGVSTEMSLSAGALALKSRLVCTRIGCAFSSATRANGLESLPRGLMPLGGFDKRWGLRPRSSGAITGLWYGLLAVLLGTTMPGALGLTRRPLFGRLLFAGRRPCF